MFAAFVREQLAPYRERLAELETEIEDLRRRAENYNRIGTVAEVDAGANLCKVSHGDNLTPWIKFMQASAGEVSETRVPSQGEQCLLINYGGGDGGAHAIALCGIPSSAFPPASTEANLHRRIYPDGTQQSYDHDAHALAWQNDKTSVAASRELVELLVNVAKVSVSPELIELKLGEVGIAIAPDGIHFTGPVVDHAGRVISKA